MKNAWLLGIVSGLVLALIPAYSASAEGLTVFSGKIDAVVDSGQEYSFVIKVQNTSESPMDISVESKGYGTGSDSSFVVLEPKDDVNPFSAREMLAVSPSSFHLKPGDSQDISVLAIIPAGIGDGGRYAIIYIYTIPQGETVKTISAMAARVLLTIDGSKLDHTGKITGFETQPEAPLDMLVTVTHNGNHHYKPHFLGKLVKEGKILSTTFTQDDWPLIPGYSRQFALNFTGNQLLPAGEYTLEIEVLDESETVTAQYSRHFNLTTDCLPSPSVRAISRPFTFTPVTITLDPYGAAVLKTADERIRINFPQGAVIGQTQLSLASYPQKLLPSLPSGCRLGSSCFEIEGLNGLLAKEATLTVKYSADDLTLAGGDASILALARWDASDKHWMILKTLVDKPNQTLAVNTNRFSIWAIVARTPVSTVAVPLIWIIVGSILLISIVIIFFRFLKRPPL